MKVIGIDPGVKNGLAEYENGVLVSVHTYSVIEIIHWLPDYLKIHQCIVVIEDSRLQSYMFTGNDKNRATALKIARNVGMVDIVCSILEELCKFSGTELIKISPKGKGEKLNMDKFRQVTGSEIKTNQHNRDAAMVAWPYRNYVQ